METALEARNVIFVYETTDTDFIDRVTLACMDEMKTDMEATFTPASRLLDVDGVKYLQVDLNYQPNGLIALLRNELHLMFMKPLRGKHALNALRAGIDWLWRNTGFGQIVCYVYSNRKDVSRLVKLAGFAPTRTWDDGTTIDGVSVSRTDFRILKLNPI